MSCGGRGGPLWPPVPPAKDRGISQRIPGLLLRSKKALEGRRKGKGDFYHLKEF